MKVFGIRDGGFYPLISTGDICEGGVTAPVFDDKIDIGCVLEFSWTPELVEAEQNGDDGVCARVSKTKALDWMVKHAGLNPTLAATVFGYTQDDFTVGGVDGTRTSAACTDVRKRGAVIVQAVSHDETEDTHVILYNVEVKMGPGGSFANEAFFESQFDGKADKSLYDCCRWFDILEHNDVVTIPTIFPGVADY